MNGTINDSLTRATARWTIAMAAAAIFAMPVSGLAQTAPPPQPPASPSQPPASQSQPAPEQNPAAEAAKVHLTAARNTLSQLTQLPAASQLQGEARTQIAQLISNFNEMITTRADWRASHKKVEGNLDALLNAAPTPDEPPPAAVGTTGVAGATGTAGARAAIDPQIRSKLMEFRSHLDRFEQAAGGAAASAAPAAPAAAAPAQDPPPNQPTSQTPPTNQTPPPTQTQPPTGAVPDEPEPPQRPNIDTGEMFRHIEAIEMILGVQADAQAAAQAAAGAVGTSGTATGSTRTTVTGSAVQLSEAQVAQLRTHLAELRKLLEDK
jgi:hypothetical protein